MVSAVDAIRLVLDQHRSVRRPVPLNADEHLIPAGHSTGDEPASLPDAAGRPGRPDPPAATRRYHRASAPRWVGLRMSASMHAWTTAEASTAARWFAREVEVLDEASIADRLHRLLLARVQILIDADQRRDAGVDIGVNQARQFEHVELLDERIDPVNVLRRALGDVREVVLRQAGVDQHLGPAAGVQVAHHPTRLPVPALVDLRPRRRVARAVIDCGAQVDASATGWLIIATLLPWNVIARSSDGSSSAAASTMTNDAASSPWPSLFD